MLSPLLLDPASSQYHLKLSLLHMAVKYFHLWSDQLHPLVPFILRYILSMPLQNYHIFDYIYCLFWYNSHQWQNTTCQMLTMRIQMKLKT